MTTADDQSVANLQRALRDITDKARIEVDDVKRYLATGVLGRERLYIEGGVERRDVPVSVSMHPSYTAYLSVRLDGWIFDSAGDEVMVCGPQGKPGFKWLKPDAKSLEARLLYALVAAIIEERGTP